MVMGRRAGVARSSWPITATDLVGLAGQLSTAMARVPFRRPWSGEGSLPHNLAVAVTRETHPVVHGVLVLAPHRRVALGRAGARRPVRRPPASRWCARSTCVQQPDTVAGVPGIWYRPRTAWPGAPSSTSTAAAMSAPRPGCTGCSSAWLCRRTGCEIFVADIRLAPEFPFPADLEDAVLVLEALLAGGVEPSRLFVAGDSSGGGLASSLMYSMTSTGHRPIAGVVLFSPELDLVLDEPSITENADRDILPWNIPTAAYLHGLDPDSGSVSAVDQDVSRLAARPSSPSGATRCSATPSDGSSTHLEEAGVDTVASEEPGMFHVFPILMPWADASRRVYRAVGEFVDRRLDDGHQDQPGPHPA